MSVDQEGRFVASKRQYRVKEEAPDALDWKTLRKAGWLTKLGGGRSTFGRRSWKRRWFELRAGVLSYAEEHGTPELGVLVLRGAHVADTSDAALRGSGAAHELSVSVCEPTRRVFRLRAPDAAAHHAWLDILRRVANSLKPKAAVTNVLVVVRDGLLLLDRETGERLAAFRINKLRNWRATAAHLCFCAEQNKRPRNFMFRAKYAAEIVRELDVLAQCRAAELGAAPSAARPIAASADAPRALTLPASLRKAKSSSALSPRRHVDRAAHVRALHDRAPASDAHLPLRKGELVRIVADLDAHTLRCETRGDDVRVGLVARADVRSCAAEIVGRARDDFDDFDLSHLRIDKGDKVIVLNRIDDECWDGYIDAAAPRSGLFPLSVIEIISGQETFDAIVDEAMGEL